VRGGRAAVNGAATACRSCCRGVAQSADEGWSVHQVGSRAAPIHATLLSPILLIAPLGLAAGVGWGAGRLLHRRRRGVLLVDVLEGVGGAALCLEVYALTGPIEHGLGEVIAVALLGAWVWVGAAHATAALLRRSGSHHDSGQT